MITIEKLNKMEEEQDLRELLQSGNIVEFRNGKMGIVIDTHLGKSIQGNGFWNFASNYDKDLNERCRECSELDIVKIGKIQFGGDVLPQYWKEASIIWERKEPKEMTLEELIQVIL
jgi:hypothetical protein